MPAILQPEEWATWLGETDASSTEVKSVLRTFQDNGNRTPLSPRPAER
ncbi:MAG: hypothetical protein EKK30_08850 [Hyphomicrobium sp.]|nr:MAG: hypothetical protein EKK30_08850 [Hyphomicrobium sp.]